MDNSIRFYDMPGNVKFQHGVVHIDMYDESPDMGQQQQGAAPSFVFSERITLTLPAFLELHKMMNQVVDSLVQSGVLSRSDNEQQVAPTEAQEPVSADTADSAPTVQVDPANKSEIDAIGAEAASEAVQQDAPAAAPADAPAQQPAKPDQNSSLRKKRKGRSNTRRK